MATDTGVAIAQKVDEAIQQAAGRVQNPEAVLKVLADLEAEFEDLFAKWHDGSYRPQKIDT